MEESTDTCIITVGSTGTGKSSTIKIFTLQDVAVSGGADSETAKCSLFTNNRDDSLPPWVDTVGWNDSTGKEDYISYQELLHFINEKNITKIKAVIWTVIPNIRKDANLQRQADFIDQICPGRVWDNVVVIARAGMNATEDCQGALEAARDKHSNGSVKCLSYRYIGHASFNADMVRRLRKDSGMRKDFSVVTDEEAYHLLKYKIDNIGEPIQIIFKNKKCVDCGFVGDERLFPKHCHMKKVMVHDDELERYHPGRKEKYHILNQVRVHSGKMYTRGGYSDDWVKADSIVKLIPFVNIVGGIVTEIGKRATYKEVEHLYRCCGKKQGTSGCKTIWDCCKREKDPGCKKKYKCCGSDVGALGCTRRHRCCMKKEKSLGCVARCNKCNELWGTESRECFKRRHNIEEL